MFNNIVNLINNNIKKNKKIILIKKKKKIINLLKLFIKLNLIKFIKINKYNNILLYLNPLFLKKRTFTLKNLYKSSNIKYIKYINIKYLNKKNELFILSTSKGLMDNYSAYKKKSGGIILMYI
jgi:ribosomal protein S8